MTTLQQAKKAAVDAAVSIAEDVTIGQLQPATLAADAVAECRELFGTVIGPDDPLWELHVDIARQAVALGAIGGDELAEWAEVFRPAEQPAVSWIEQALAAGDDEDEDEGEP